MKYRLLAFFLIISTLKISAQEKDKKEIDSLLDKAWEHHTKIELLPALENSKRALSMAIKSKYDKGKGEAYFMAADALLNIGLYKEALNYLEEIKSTNYYKTTPIVKSEVHRLRARAYVKLKLYQLAVNELRGQSALIKGLTGQQREMSLLYQYGNLADVFKKINNLDSIEKYGFMQLEVLKQFDENQMHFNYMNTYNDLGELFTKKKDFLKAAFYLDKSLSIIEKFDVKVFFNTMIFYGALESELGNNKKALSYYIKALENIRSTEDHDALKTHYKFMAEFYRETLKDNETANQYLLNYAIINDSLETKNARVIDTALNQILRTKQLESSTTVINYRNLFITFAVILTIILLLVLIRLKKNNSVLQEKQEVLQQQTSINKELTEKIEDKRFNELVALAKSNNPEFFFFFSKNYPMFAEGLKEKCPDIRSSELEFCAMAALNFSTKNIADYTFVTIRAVQIRKNRLRKRLNIPSEVDFNKWMMDIITNNVD